MISVPFAVKNSPIGAKLTPTGASPPGVGVAVTMLVPAAGPSVQHTLALPVRSDVVEADVPKVPQSEVVGSFGAMLPPPCVTSQEIGTVCISVPLRVVT